MNNETTASRLAGPTEIEVEAMRLLLALESQILAETGAADLTDCSAWFGYTGDRKSSVLSLRVDFRPTPYRYLIVKWFAALPPAAQTALIDKIAGIGPF